MSKTYRITLLPGDGIGPEIMAQARRVLDTLGARFGFSCAYAEALLGGAAIDATGDPFPEETRQLVADCDAVLLAAIGGPKWDTTDPDKPRPEQGLLGLRKALGAYANLRPVRIFDALRGASPLKPQRLEGVNLLVVRELIGGLYFGARERFYDEENAGAGGVPGQRAYDTLEYREYEIERIARVAFEQARARRGKLHSVDKANVIETSRLWREIVHRVAHDYPEIELIDMLVDNTAMQLINDPAQFDVIVTENMFGDILSDEASMLTGSLGMLASASLGDGVALYEPIHGSAPDIAGRDIANPLAMLLSCELMLRSSLNEPAAADALSNVISNILAQGWRTADIADAATPTDKIVGTRAMGDLIVAVL
ncbi:MAG: 3-isopropylmalate dehydrogenase [Coriobacteriia bacterium]|nr:3-isopropylmalate dehydrogenase [Coriobacteriia bacterium]